MTNVAIKLGKGLTCPFTEDSLGVYDQLRLFLAIANNSMELEIKPRVTVLNPLEGISNHLHGL